MSAGVWKSICPGRARRSSPGPTASADLGLSGEAIAARYLESSGCPVLERRWRSDKTDTGEIDLIVRDGDEIVFVEVKTRSSAVFGFPEEAVTAGKRGQLRRTAEAFLQERGWAACRFRIDVIAILEPAGGGRISLRHLRSAVGESD